MKFLFFLKGSLAVSIKFKVGHFLQCDVLISDLYLRELLIFMQKLVCPIILKHFSPSGQRTKNNLHGHP